MGRTYKKTHIIIHHSATTDGKETNNWAGICNYHQSKGWRPPCGYHWGIEYVGGKIKVHKGRDELDSGAHCKEGSMNYLGIGICLVGNFDEELPTEEQYQTLAKLCKEIMARHDIPVGNIKMHRDYAINSWTGKPYKSCPGWKLDIKKLRNIIKGEGETVTVPEWKQAIMDEAEGKGLISADHNPDDTATKWFVLAVVLNVIKYVRRG